MVHYAMFDTETNLGNGNGFVPSVSYPGADSSEFVGLFALGLIGPDNPGGSSGDTDTIQTLYANQQVDWLAADLAAVNRTLTPWVVTAGHRPWYVTGGCDVCQEAFEEIFLKYEVDLVVQGEPR